MKTRYIDVTLNALVIRNAEEILDLLEEEFCADDLSECDQCGALIPTPGLFLSNISYRPIAVLADCDTIRLEVTADIESMDPETDDGCCNDCR